MNRRRKIAAGAAFALAIWSFMGFLIVPWLVARELPTALTEALDVDVAMGDVRSNPFLLTLEVDAIELSGPASGNGQERLTLEALVIDVDFLSLLRLTPEIAVSVQRPALRLTRAADGAIPILAWRRPAESESPGEARDGELPELLLSVNVEGGSITFRDAALSTPASVEVQTWSLTIAGFDPSGTAPAAPVSLSARSSLGDLDFEGAISSALATGSIALAEAPLVAFAPWVTNDTPLTDLAGTVAFRADLQIDESALKLDSAALDLSRLGAQATTDLFEGVVELGGATLSGVALDLPFDAPELADLHADRLALQGLDLSVSLVPGPGLSHAAISFRTLELDAPGRSAERIAADRLAIDGPALAVTLTDALDAPQAPSGSGSASEALATPSPGLALELGALDIDDLSLTLTDPRISEKARIAFDSGRIDLGRLSLNTRQALALPLSFDLAVGQSGTVRLEAAGEVAAGAARNPEVRARVTSDALRLAALAPWLRAVAGADLLRGTLTADLDVHWKDEASMRGNVSLGQLRLRDGTGVPLFSHERLDLEGIDIDTGTRSARIDALLLHQPRARFARYADGQTNLDSLTYTSSADNGKEEPAAGSNDAPWSWEVGRFALSDGFLNVVDETLITPFATSIETLEGEAGAFGTEQPIINVQLSGVIPPVGRMQARAVTDTRDPLARADLDLDFTRLSLLRLSPYSSTFAGRHIESGELGLELEYRIEGGRLRAANRAAIESLRLGERVDSPAAVQLPLDLAIAVLQDADGRIELDVPVSGDVDDPEFDLTPAVLRALRVVITNVAAAPFKMLGAIVGSDRDLEGIDFDFGSAELDAEATETIGALAAVLQRRPALALTISPVHAGRPDRDALRIATLDAELADFGADRDAAILALARKRFDAEVIEGLQEQYGDVEGRESAISEELAGLLLARTEVADEDVARLATARATAAAEALASAGLSPERVRVAKLEEDESQAAERMHMRFELRAANLSPAGATPAAAPRTTSPASGR